MRYDSSFLLIDVVGKISPIEVDQMKGLFEVDQSSLNEWLKDALYLITINNINYFITPKTEFYLNNCSTTPFQCGCYQNMSVVFHRDTMECYSISIQL